MKKIVPLYILVSLLTNFPLFSQNNSNTSIAMLNYLATESRVVISSKNNRLVLENIYNMLINNTNPGIVDETTQYYMEIMLDDIESFRMNELQRERLQFLFANSQAQAITKAMPNPLYLLGNLVAQGSSGGTGAAAGAAAAGAAAAGAAGAATAGAAATGAATGAAALGVAGATGALVIIAIVALMTIDSVMQYQNAKNEGLIQFLKNDWDLDDKEATTLHNLRKRTFSYMIDIARVNSLKSSDTLNEESIDNFVSITLYDNLQRKKQALESNRNIYSKYGAYWLELANTYYKLEFYKECIQAIKEYEAIQAPIFRKDFDYAKVLPFVIISASYVYKNVEDYSAHVNYYLKKLIENTSESQWALRYFAAQNYIHLATIANKNENLLAAYNLILNNVRVLSIEQEKMLNEYYSPITTVPQSLIDARSDAQKKLTQAKIDKERELGYKNIKLRKEQKAILDNNIKEANKKLKDCEIKISEYIKLREKELPPFSNALWINYVLLNSLYEPLNKSDIEKKHVNEIIDEAFFPLSIMDRYWKETTKDDYGKHFSVSSISKSVSISLSNVKNYGLNLFYLNCPDVLLTAVNSMDVKIYNASKNTILCDAKDVKWEVSSKINRNFFISPYLFLAEIVVYLDIDFYSDVKKKEFCKMIIYIKNIDEKGSYNNRLYFEKPAGKTKWVFKYVE
jgi:hypothetical protein